MKIKSMLIAIPVALWAGLSHAQDDVPLSPIPKGAKYIDSAFIESLKNEDVRNALSNKDVIKLIVPDLNDTNVKVGTKPIKPIRPVRDALLSPEVISKLSSEEVQEALKLPEIQGLVFGDGSVSYGGRPVGQPQPRPRGGKFIAPELLQTLGDKDVQDALQLPAIVKLIELNGGQVSYNGRPVGQPQPRPRGGYLAPELIESLGKAEVQEALKLPLVQELIFGQNYDPAAYNGRPVGMGQPRPRS